MNNDNKKLDEVKETIAKEEIENKTHEEKIESEDTMQRISEKDIHKDVNVKSKKYGTHFESRIFHLHKIFHCDFLKFPYMNAIILQVFF